MGFIYHKVIKNENKAMNHFTNALKLAEVLKSSKDLDQEDWFQKATRIR